MIKKGISGIILCFFCCVQCFPVFAQEIEQEIVINEDGENSIIENTQEGSEDSAESSSSADGEDNSSDMEDGTQEEENPLETENNSNQSENPSDGEENPENPDENNQETPEIIFPEIFIDFQNPSYILEKDIQKLEYSCDPEREECKVNIQILDENQGEISSDFGCEIIFSNSEEFADCNPTSVVLEESENIINIKIFEENNIDNFIEKEIIILKNNISEENSGDENPSDGEENPENPDENNQETPEIIFPEIFIDFQNPSYILEKDIQKQEYSCDPEREECKVNIKILDENQGEISSDFGCEIIFSNSEEFADCNPTTVVLEDSENIINIKIFEENNIDNFIEKEIIILKNDISEENPGDENPENGGENSGETGNEDEEIIDENENTNSGEDNSQNPDNGTGSIENPDDNNEEIPEIIFPEIFIDFQNPSYILEKDIQKQEYSCDSDQEECKINIKILDENQGEISSDFGCEIIFSNGEEFTDCNPTSIVFTEPENIINIKIFEENNLENFIENEIIILKNDISEENLGDENPETPDENSGEDGNIDEVDGVENNEEIPEELEVPEIFFEIQSGAEISGDSLVCDKNNCSLNLNIEKSFQGDFIENNYICEWDFGGGNFSTPETYKKCNPGYVKYNVGEYQLSVKIIDKENPNNFSQKILYVKNSKKSSNKGQSNGGSKGNTNSETENTIVDISENKEIFVQSGLENNRCNEEKCSVNLQYKNASYEECIWNFGDLETREKYTQTCNPRNIYVPSGGHKIKLLVKNNKTNTSHNKILFIHNIYEEKTVEKTYNFEIILQGKQTDFRKKIGDDIICLGVEKCNVNLSIKNYKNLEYSWEFPNNFIVQKNNPKSVWFEVGEHNILLNIYEDKKLLASKEIGVQVVAAENREEIIHLVQKVERFEHAQKNYLGFFSEFNVQPKNLDNIQDKARNYFTQELESNKKNISNTFNKISYFDSKADNKRLKLTRNISQQKKALKISGTTFPNSTVYVDDGEKIITISSDKVGKYQLKKQSNVKSGNFLVDYYVIDEFGNYFQANNFKELAISNEYIGELTHNIEKKSSKQSEKSITNTKNIIDEHRINVNSENMIEFSGLGINQGIEPMNILQKILWAIISFLGLLGLIIVGKKYKIM